MKEKSKLILIRDVIWVNSYIIGYLLVYKTLESFFRYVYEYFDYRTFLTNKGYFMFCMKMLIIKYQIKMVLGWIPSKKDNKEVWEIFKKAKLI